MNSKSPTCIGKKSGKPLIEYTSEEDALEGAEYSRERYGTRMVPYQCDTCGMWHLSPEGRQTPSSKCPICRGADGKPKDSYQTEDDAWKRARILRKEQGAVLRVYRCEHGHGWHLTRG